MISLFGRRRTLAEAGALTGMTDWHSHILPGVDDGLGSVADSLEALREYGALGIREVWLTPHVMEDMPNTTEGLRERFGGAFLTTVNAAVGVSYRFGKRDFERGAAGYTKADVEALKAEAEKAAAQVEADKAAKEDLSGELAQAEKDAAAAQQRADQAEQQLADAQAELEALKQQMALDAATPEETIFFDYEVWGLDAVDMTALKELATKILAGPKDYVYTITGYADFTTGARSNNITIAERRAQSVYDYLVSLGVPAAQLTHQGAGPDAQPLTGRGNQSVTIK